jgi:hypothetical protein
MGYVEEGGAGHYEPSPKDQRDDNKDYWDKWVKDWQELGTSKGNLAELHQRAMYDELSEGQIYILNQDYQEIANRVRGEWHV